MNKDSFEGGNEKTNPCIEKIFNIDHFAANDLGHAFLFLPSLNLLENVFHMLMTSIL